MLRSARPRRQISSLRGHPDHAIFYVSLGLVLLFRQGLRATIDSVRARFGKRAPSELRSVLRWLPRSLVGYAVPFLLLYLPYFVWRSVYYGDLVPNTYHAKSGSDAYFQQGFIYLGISAMHGGIWSALPFALGGMVAHRRTLSSQFSTLSLPILLP